MEFTPPPTVSLRLNSGQVDVVWNKNGMEAVEIQQDTGNGWQFLALETRPANGSITVSLPQSQATLLATGQKLETTRNGDQLTIQLPDKLPDPIATVIRLDP